MNPILQASTEQAAVACRAQRPERPWWSDGAECISPGGHVYKFLHNGLKGVVEAVRVARLLPDDTLTPWKERCTLYRYGRGLTVDDDEIVYASDLKTLTALGPSSSGFIYQAELQASSNVELDPRSGLLYSLLGSGNSLFVRIQPLASIKAIFADSSYSCKTGSDTPPTYVHIPVTMHPRAEGSNKACRLNLVRSRLIVRMDVLADLPQQHWVHSNAILTLPPAPVLALTARLATLVLRSYCV